MAEPLYGDPLKKFIADEALRRKLDPLAVLSVANVEGGFSGAVGDSGSSFGPFQLHIGGALPSSVATQGADYAKTWANTPEGLSYALDRIGAIAAGQKGISAIAAIVNLFERPTAPGPEVQRAWGTYQGWSSSGGGITGTLGDVLGGIGDAPGKVKGAVTGGVDAVAGAAGDVKDATVSVGKFLGKLADPHFWLRALQVVAGAILVGTGLVLLAAQVGLSTPTGKTLAGAAMAAA